MERRNHTLSLAALLGSLLVLACDSDAESASHRSATAVDPATGVPSTTDPTGTDPTGAPSTEPDPSSLFSLYVQTAEDRFGRWEKRFLHAGDDAGVEETAAQWGKVAAKDLGPIIDDFAPSPWTPIPDGPGTSGAEWAPTVPSNPALQDLEPCDRPEPGLLRYNNCSAEDRERIEVAFDRIQFGTWRALQRIHHVLDAPNEAIAEQRWNAQAPGHTTAPLAFFGAYSAAKAQGVRDILEAGWAQMQMDGEIEMNCWSLPKWWQVLFFWPKAKHVLMKSPCATNSATAHTIWVGHPPLNPWVHDPSYELCPDFFDMYDKAPAEDLNAFQGGILGTVLLHEMLHWNVVGDCGGFPDSSCDSVGPAPAYRDFQRFDGQMLKDSWPDKAACELVGDGNKCYAEEEALALAIEDGSAAVRLPAAYQYFAFRTGHMYTRGDCDVFGNVCFESDADVCEEPSCGLPGGESCEDNPGQPGCGCLDVDGWLDGESGYADGAGSFLTGGEDGQYCPGEDVVCGVHPTSCGDISACQSCGEDTNVGCGCDADSDCGGLEPGLRCWGGNEAGWPQAPSGSGTCLPDASTPHSRDELEGMPWFCLDNCEATDQWSGMAQCVYNQGAYVFDHGTCMHDGACGGGYGYPGACEEDGFVCNGDNDCEAECQVDADCPSIGFPGSYSCRDFGTTKACVPPECAGGDLLGYCGLFAPAQ